MCPGHPYMLGGGTSVRGQPPRRPWRDASSGRCCHRSLRGADDLAGGDAALDLFADLGRRRRGGGIVSLPFWSLIGSARSRASPASRRTSS
jgi:hypothetical protein